jgi:hypothetical protein
MNQKLICVGLVFAICAGGCGNGVDEGVVRTNDNKPDDTQKVIEANLKANPPAAKPDPAKADPITGTSERANRAKTEGATSGGGNSSAILD